MTFKFNQCFIFFVVSIIPSTFSSDFIGGSDKNKGSVEELKKVVDKIDELCTAKVSCKECENCKGSKRCKKEREVDIFMMIKGSKEGISRDKVAEEFDKLGASYLAALEVWLCKKKYFEPMCYLHLEKFLPYRKGQSYYYPRNFSSCLVKEFRGYIKKMEHPNVSFKFHHMPNTPCPLYLLSRLKAQIIQLRDDNTWVGGGSKIRNTKHLKFYTKLYYTLLAPYVHTIPSVKDSNGFCRLRSDELYKLLAINWIENDGKIVTSYVPIIKYFSRKSDVKIPKVIVKIINNYLPITTLSQDFFNDLKNNNNFNYIIDCLLKEEKNNNNNSVISNDLPFTRNNVAIIKQLFLQDTIVFPKDKKAISLGTFCKIIENENDILSSQNVKNYTAGFINDNILKNIKQENERNKQLLKGLKIQLNQEKDNYKMVKEKYQKLLKKNKQGQKHIEPSNSDVQGYQIGCFIFLTTTLLLSIKVLSNKKKKRRRRKALMA